MKIPANVKSIPLSKGIPLGFAFFGNIYFRKYIYDNLKSSKPNPEYVGYLLHEQAHINRLSNLDYLVFWFNPKLRFREELAADKARFKYLKKNKVKFNFENRAKALSGVSYLWCTSYQKAKKELKKAWGEA